jgi:hypothetical protein
MLTYSSVLVSFAFIASVLQKVSILFDDFFFERNVLCNTIFSPKNPMLFRKQITLRHCPKGESENMTGTSKQVSDHIHSCNLSI